MSTRPAPFDIMQSVKQAAALLQSGRQREAEKICARALKAAPDCFDALNLLGIVKAQLGRMGEAQRLFAAAARINPRLPSVWVNLGQALHALKRGDEALASLEQARALAPADAGVLYQHACVLMSLGRTEQALAEFRQLLASAPQHAQARLNCAIAQAALGYPEQALGDFDAALAMMPGHAGAHHNRALALYELARYGDALEAHQRALALAPDYAASWYGRGRALAALSRHDEALASYAKARGTGKDDADLQFSEAIALLSIGDYRRGFEKYESRWRRTGMPAPTGRGRPLWRGEYPLAQRTVLLHAEQGLGDTIQLARYVPLLAASGARIVLEVQSELTALMASLDGGATVIARGAAPPPFDVHCPLGSLPLALRTDVHNVPAPIPYLSAGTAARASWSARLGALPRPRIALAWSGNPAHVNDRNRSLAFAALAPLLSAPASLLSIQRELRQADADMLAREPRVTHLGDQLHSFADTAAIVADADLVISADTAVAHLAGAMGKPLWLLLPFTSDWRWTRDGDKSPWYPAARLFRQRTLGDWAGVVDRLAEELAHLGSGPLEAAAPPV